MNTTQVVANWLVGREIVEEEQKGQNRADYGKRLVATLSMQITREFGPGYSVQNLFYFKQFYLTYSNLLSPNLIFHTTRGELSCERPSKKLHALRGESESAWKQPEDRYCGPIVDAVRQLSGASIGYAVRSQSWIPGQLHPNLSWTHYRTLLRADKPEARSFYEIEALKNMPPVQASAWDKPASGFLFRLKNGKLYLELTKRNVFVKNFLERPACLIFISNVSAEKT